MFKVKQEYLFSSDVSDTTDVNDFIVEFYCDDLVDSTPVIITRNFDDLIEFFDAIEE
ncbi:hypothetical protein [Bacillus sp. JJ1764]|uniref:hypothetical protein n=1 Tax=Bacillus sp. JJ1764 TaxID=3122964 RepID=UPI002FFD601B